MTYIVTLLTENKTALYWSRGNGWVNRLGLATQYKSPGAAFSRKRGLEQAVSFRAGASVHVLVRNQGRPGWEPVGR